MEVGKFRLINNNQFTPTSMEISNGKSFSVIGNKPIFSEENFGYKT